jgi:hypothetical protein
VSQEVSLVQVKQLSGQLEHILVPSAGSYSSVWQVVSHVESVRNKLLKLKYFFIK